MESYLILNHYMCSLFGFSNFSEFKKQFEDVFGRYLPSPAPALQSVTTAQIKPGAGFPPFPKRNTNQNVTDQKPWKVNGGAGCAVVTDGNSAPGGEGMADGEMNLFEGVI